MLLPVGKGLPDTSKQLSGCAEPRGALPSSQPDRPATACRSEHPGFAAPGRVEGDLWALSGIVAALVDKARPAKRVKIYK